MSADSGCTCQKLCPPALYECRIPWIACRQLQLRGSHASHTGLMAPAPLGPLLPAVRRWRAAAHRGVPCQQWNGAGCSSVPRRGASNQPSLQHTALHSCVLEGERHQGISADQVCSHAASWSEYCRMCLQVGEYGNCNATCDSGTMSRAVNCSTGNGTAADSLCSLLPR